MNVRHAQNGQVSEHLADVVTIVLHTGMRKDESLKMHRQRKDVKEGIITIPRHEQKGKKRDKRVSINFVTRAILERLVSGVGKNGFLFENPATGRPITDVKTSWLHAIKEAGLSGKPGVDRLRIHDLRHTAATRLTRNTKNMKLVAQYLGHTDIKTTARYLHPDDKDLAEAAESLVPPKSTPGGEKGDSRKVASIRS